MTDRDTELRLREAAREYHERRDHVLITEDMPGTTAEWSWPQTDDAAYVGLPGDIVRKIEPHTESDPVALLLAAHVMFGSVLGRGAHYLVEGTRHHANLYGLLVGATSKARKGAATDRVNRRHG